MVGGEERVTFTRPDSSTRCGRLPGEAEQPIEFIFKTCATFNGWKAHASPLLPSSSRHNKTGVPHTTLRKMAHGSLEQDGVGQRHGHGIWRYLSTSAEHYDDHSVQDRNCWSLGGGNAQDNHRSHHRHHRHRHLPVPTSDDTPVRGVLPAIPRRPLPLPDCGRRSDHGITRGIDTSIGSGEHHQQVYEEDLRWGSGPQHQQHREVALGSGIGQRSYHVEPETLHYRATAAGRQKDGDMSSFSRARSMFWRMPTFAPLPQLPSPHRQQPRESWDDDKAEVTPVPTSHEASVPGSPKRKGGSQNPKRLCQHPSCRRSPSFSKVGQRAVFCAQHKLGGMVNVVSRKCAAPGCTKGPSFGPPDKRPVFCSRHRLPGHINVVSPKCAQDGCRTGPSFARSGTGNKAAYCAKHKLVGMVNVISRVCEREGCHSAPSFGFEGGRPAFCGRHKQAGQRNVVSRRCAGPDCTKVPSYGKPGDPRPTFCAYHKPPGAINLLSTQRKLKNRFCRLPSV